MNQEQAGIILAKCSAFDNRKPSLASAEAWADALDPKLNVPDALAIVVAHYRASREWIMPADINREGKRIRLERIRAAKAQGEILPPVALEPHIFTRWCQTATDAIGAGADRTSAEAAAWHAIGQQPPAIEATINHQINTNQIGHQA